LRSPSLGKLDDALGDDFVGAIRAFGKTECDPGHFERDPDDAPDFGIGFQHRQEMACSAWGVLTGAGGSATGLSATGLLEPPPVVPKP